MCVLVGVGATLLASCDFSAARDTRPWQLEVQVDADGRVPAVGPLRIALDRRLSPWSVDRASVSLTSGNVGEWTFPSTDPTRNELVIELARPLLPETSYVITLRALEALDGRVLAADRQLLVTSNDETELPPRPTFGEAAQVLELLRARCAGSGCHDATSRASGLVLDGPDGIAETAIGQPATEVALNVGIDARATGLWGLPIIAANGQSTSVGFSYLIYKVLGDPRVLGEVMPPPAVGAALSAEEVELLARWIRAGAPLE